MPRVQEILPVAHSTYRTAVVLVGSRRQYPSISSPDLYVHLPALCLTCHRTGATNLPWKNIPPRGHTWPVASQEPLLLPERSFRELSNSCFLRFHPRVTDQRMFPITSKSLLCAPQLSLPKHN